MGEGRWIRIIEWAGSEERKQIVKVVWGSEGV